MDFRSGNRRGSLRRKIVGCAGILLTATCVAAFQGGPVSATVLVATYQGTIGDGTDGAGFFGASGANLAGDAVKVVYTYDTSLGVRDTDPGISDSLNGGSDFGTSSIYQSVRLTINGTTIDVPTGDVSAAHGNYILQYELPFQSTTYVYDSLIESDGDNLENLVRVFNPPASIEIPFSGTGSFNGGGELYSGGAETFFGFEGSGSVDVALAAPEPSAWFLVLLGFGGLGVAARARRAGSEARDGGDEKRLI